MAADNPLQRPLKGAAKRGRRISRSVNKWVVKRGCMWLTVKAVWKMNKLLKCLGNDCISNVNC